LCEGCLWPLTLAVLAGDQPEARWSEAGLELAAMGYSSTLEYVEAAATAVIESTGLLPHINAGLVSEAWLARFKHVSASQGLMLEGTAPSLQAAGALVFVRLAKTL
jgi:FO synthase